MSNKNHSELPLSVIPAAQEVDWWLLRHKDKLTEIQRMKTVDLVFLGDSITQAWEQEGADAWNKYYSSQNALNLGFNGDRTEHVLWRIAHGELDNIQPKVLVLLIGTNNSGHRLDKAEETALGIKTILEAVKKKLPQTKIMLLAIFPRSAKPTQRLRILNQQVNRLIESYEDKKTVFFVDINKAFLNEKNEVTKEVMSDFLHLNCSQYFVFAKTISSPTLQLMAL